MDSLRVIRNKFVFWGSNDIKTSRFRFRLKYNLQKQTLQIINSPREISTNTNFGIIISKSRTNLFPLTFKRYYSTEIEKKLSNDSTLIPSSSKKTEDQNQKNLAFKKSTPKFKFRKSKIGKSKKTVQEWINIAEANRYKLSDIGRFEENKISITNPLKELETSQIDEDLEALELLKLQLDEITVDILPSTREDLNKFISPEPIYKNRNLSLGDELPSKFISITQAEKLVTLNSKSFHCETLPFYIRNLSASLQNDFNQFSKDRYYKQSNKIICQDSIQLQISELFENFNENKIDYDQTVHELSSIVQDYLNTYPSDSNRLEFFTFLFKKLDDDYQNFSSLENVLLDSMINSTIDNQNAGLVNAINQKRMILDKFLLATLKKNNKVELKTPSLPLDPGDIETSALNIKYSSWLNYLLLLGDSYTYHRIVRFYLRLQKPEKLINSLINYIMEQRFEVEGRLDKGDELTKLMEVLLVYGGSNIAKRIMISLNEKYHMHPTIQQINELDSYEIIKNDVELQLQVLKLEKQKKMIELETQKRFDQMLEKNKGIFMKHIRIKTPYSELKKQIRKQVTFEVEELGIK